MIAFMEFEGLEFKVSFGKEFIFYAI